MSEVIYRLRMSRRAEIAVPAVPAADESADLFRILQSSYVQHLSSPLSSPWTQYSSPSF